MNLSLKNKTNIKFIMSGIKLLKTCLLLSVAIVLWSGPAVLAQKCALRIGAWESYPEEVTPDGGRLRTRKATVRGFTATATSQRSKKIFRGVPLMGYVYFENIPLGSYDITVRRVGFKTSIESHTFSCDYADNGFDFVDVLLFRGTPTQIVRSEPSKIPPRDPNKYTVIGDRNYIGTGSDNPLPTRAPRTISGGVLNGKAATLPKPAYPPAARAVRASGAVIVQVLINEKGDVIKATAAGGHPLLQPAAVEAAREAKFSPTLVDGVPVKVSGVITYNFVP